MVQTACWTTLALLELLALLEVTDSRPLQPLLASGRTLVAWRALACCRALACWVALLPLLQATCLARLPLWAGETAQCLRSPRHCRLGHFWWRSRTLLAVRGTTTMDSWAEGLEMTRRRRRERGLVARMVERQESVRLAVPVT